MGRREHPDDDSGLRLMARWALAAFCVGTVHAGGAWAVLNWQQSPVAASEPAAAIMIELAPVPLAPEVPLRELAAGPDTPASAQSDPNEVQEQALAEEPPATPPPTTTPPGETPPAKESTETVADLPKTTSEVAPPPPEKRSPPAEAPKADKPPEKAKADKPTRSQRRKKADAQVAAAPKPLPAPRAKTNAASTAGASSAVATQTWQGMVIAHLNGHRRHPAGGGSGLVTIAVAIDNSGHVLSVRLIGSSGNAAIDAEAVALARRASPVPAPPAGVKRIDGKNVMLTVPIKFTR